MSKRTIPAALVAAFFLAAAIACSTANAPTTSNDAAKTPSAPAPPAANNAASSPMRVQLNIDPAEPAPNKPAKFDVKLTSTDGKPVSGANVTASLVMKTMDMGKNEFPLADKGNGDYQGEGKFGMSGDWNVVITAKQADKTVVQSFPAKSVMPKP